MNSLTVLNNATQMLAEVKTIDDAKQLMDVAASAKYYAQKHGLGKQAVDYAREIEVEAEIKLGEFLIAMDKNKGAQGIGTSAVSNNDRTLRLEDIGVSKNLSSEAQALASLPEKEKTKVKSGKKSKRAAVKESKAAKQKETIAASVVKIQEKAIEDISSVCDIRHCSMQELLQSVKPDCVITDPPYPKEYLRLYTDLARLADFVPLVAVMCGQSYLPEIISAMSEHLLYRWTLAYLTPGGQSVQLWDRKVNTFWKPVLLFGKANSWIGDVCQSSVNDNDKRFHNWGQSESGMADLVERLTKPGQLVCDPFGGAFTTAVVSLALGRRFVGCDTDKTCVEKGLTRCRNQIEKSGKSVRAGAISG
jgi:site-specific DNA-methyltransferase (adenine-specific)